MVARVCITTLDIIGPIFAQIAVTTLLLDQSTTQDAPADHQTQAPFSAVVQVRIKLNLNPKTLYLHITSTHCANGANNRDGA